MRPARASELPAAIRLIVQTASGQADPWQQSQLLDLARAHRADPQGLWVALQSGRLVSAVMPLVSPGRTMLLFVPGRLSDPVSVDGTRQLVEMICGRAAEAGVHLAQVLLDVAEASVYRLLTDCGFKDLAELLYLQASCGPESSPALLPEGFRWVGYSAQTHHLFAQTVLATYQRSLDCPILAGLREIEDVLAGHRSTGESGVSLWHLLCSGDRGVAVLLLSRIPASDVMELVYLGVVPECRGRGVGDLLMRQAFWVAWQAGCCWLSMAVDASNVPALGLYWRHGLQVIGRKRAMLRDLRIPVVSLGPPASGAVQQAVAHEGKSEADRSTG